MQAPEVQVISPTYTELTTSKKDEHKYDSVANVRGQQANQSCYSEGYLLPVSKKAVAESKEKHNQL